MEYKLISHSLDHPLRLYDHINQVVKATKYLITQKSLNFNGISKKQIEELGILIAISHDFGKSTLFFQKYIQSKIKGTKYIGNEQEKSHSLISAFFGWFMVEKRISKYLKINEHWKSFLPFAVFLAIEGHHGIYKSIEELLKNIDINLLKKQIDNIDPEIFEYEFLDVKLSDGKDFKIDVVDSISSKLRKLHRKYAKKYPIEVQIEHRILALLLYSILLESDKAYLASDNPKQYEREPIDIPDDLVDKHLKKLDDSKLIDEERNKAYKETIANVNIFPLNERIHSITLPTGLGKTLLSSSMALKLRKRIEKEEGFIPKIIVSLPFLSIIEQTDEVYKEFLGELYKKHKDRLYMPRYSIADFEYRDGVDDEERSDNSVDFYLNIWNSEIIVSTFDQLLYSLFSLKSKHLMRFHNLFNSILIFDEIQALPSELWKPFEYFFKKLTEVGNTYVLLMSATQPKFFPDTVERVPNHEDYFKKCKRVKLCINTEKKSVKSFAEELPGFLNERLNKSVIVALNTRESSKFVFKEINNMAKEKIISGRPIIYLSSLIAPSQRSKRILEIKRCIKRGENPVIVTTQCIEAGVDIDVDYILRDWAPLDSIFQICGRCNRNEEKEMGTINIIFLKNERERLFSEMIYDEILLECTAFSITENLYISEEQFYNIGNHYFELVRDHLGKSMKIVNAYAQYTHKYEDEGEEKAVNIKKFLRGNEHQEQFIIPSLDEKLPGEIRQACGIEDRWDRRFALKKLAKRIAANSVSIRFEKWNRCSPDDLTIDSIGNFRILNEQFYDKKGVGLDVDLKNFENGILIL